MFNTELLKTLTLSCMSSTMQVRDNCLIISGRPVKSVSPLPRQNDWLWCSMTDNKQQSESIDEQENKPPTRKQSDSDFDDDILKVTSMNLAKFSETFDFPLKTNRLAYLVERGSICNSEVYYFLDTTRPVVHADVLSLMDEFLDIKRTRGSQVERRFYRTFNVTTLIDRLLTKRAVTFSGPKDDYVLRNGEQGSGGFELVGSDLEKAPLMLENYLSYDEMKLSAFLAISSPTAFINDCRKGNNGLLMVAEKMYTIRGVVIGLTPPRFERQHLMEYQDMVADLNAGDEDRISALSPFDVRQIMHRMWAHFYKVPPYPNLVTDNHQQEKKPDEVNNETKEVADPIFLQFGSTGRYFNVVAYRRRIHLMAETLLLEANLRAAVSNRLALIHVAPLFGIGVGQSNDKLFDQWYLEGFALALANLDLLHIGVVAFEGLSSINQAKLDEIVVPKNKKIHLCLAENNSPARNVQDDMLVVLTYAANCNSYPGNDYWLGSLTDAICTASLISELHNPAINPAIRAHNAKIIHPSYDDV